jgi:hypothetical protein
VRPGGITRGRINRSLAEVAIPGCRLSFLDVCFLRDAPGCLARDLVLSAPFASSSPTYIFTSYIITGPSECCAHRQWTLYQKFYLIQWHRSMTGLVRMARQRCILSGLTWRLTHGRPGLESLRLLCGDKLTPAKPCPAVLRQILEAS